MAVRPSTGRVVPSASPASHRQVGSQALAAAQLQLIYDREAEVRSDEQALTAMFGAAVRAFGGPDALRAALGEKESYLARIVDMMSGERPVQLRCVGPLLKDPRSAVIVLTAESELANFEPPVSRREVSDEDIARAALEVIAESGQLRETFRQQIAKRLGVRPEAVKL